MNIHEYIYTDFIRRMCATFRSSELMIFIYEGLRFNSSLFIITSNFNFIDLLAKDFYKEEKKVVKEKKKGGKMSIKKEKCIDSFSQERKPNIIKL
mgnify:CR=1 FL=1